MRKQQKTFFVQNLTEGLKTASSVILVDHSGLSVKMQQDLKKRLAAAGANLAVVKNTLFKLAARGAKVPKETISDTVLTGPTAIVIAEKDPIAPLQVLSNFAKEFDIPKLKVGVVEGSFQDKKSLLKLAKLSSKEALFGQAVSAIAGPMYGLVWCLQGNIQKLLYILIVASQSNNKPVNP